jgi:hypothetical protein
MNNFVKSVNLRNGDVTIWSRIEYESEPPMGHYPVMYMIMAESRNIVSCVNQKIPEATLEYYTEYLSQNEWKEYDTIEEVMQDNVELFL